MRCQSVRDLLSPYIDLVLSEEDKTRVEQHLAECSSCRGRLAELKSTVKMLHGMKQHTAPSAFMDELHKRLQQEKVVPFDRPDDSRNNHLISSTAGWFAASVASIALIAGIYISSLVPFPMVASLFDKMPQIIAPRDGSLSRDIEQFLKEKELQMRTALINSQQDRDDPKDTGNNQRSTVSSGKSRAQQVAVNPGTEPGNAPAQSLSPMLINTVSLQLKSGDSGEVSDGLIQLAAANEARVETSTTQLMSGVSKVVTVRVSPEKVDSILAGVKSLGCQTEPMQGIQDVSQEYSRLKNRLTEVEAEITRLKSKDPLNTDESDKLKAMIFEKSYLQDKMSGLEENTKMVAINIVITEEPNH